MLSIVIPTLNAAAGLTETLRALTDPPLETEIVVVDGGSSDGTAVLATRLGARALKAPRGRGAQLAEGARQAAGGWLLFLHADTRLGEGWAQAVLDFTRSPGAAERAAYFRYALDDDALEARRLEAMVAWRCKSLDLPYGDQGLVISKPFYERLGGYKPMPLMEDVDLVRRIGGHKLTALDVPALTSADKYQRDGYILRPLRNLSVLALYFLGVSPEKLAKLYG